MDKNVFNLLLNSKRPYQNTSFTNALNRYLRKVELMQKVDINPIYFSEEVDEKLIRLKELEERDDLGVIDYLSWHVLPKNFQITLFSTINALKWGGVYFSYSAFERNLSIIFKGAPNSISFLVINYIGGKRILSIGEDATFYNFLGAKSFLEFKEEVNSLGLKTIGFTDQGPILKDFTRESTSIPNK